MKLIKFEKYEYSTLSLEQIFARFDELCANNWRNHVDEMISLTNEMSREDQLLRFFIKGVCSRMEFPKMIGAQSFPIISTDHMFIRINVWLPRHDDSSKSESFRRYLSIDELHNHDFSFFTTNIYGSGYTSTFFRDPDHHPDRKIGDPVALAMIDTFQLSKNCGMFVESGADYHSQHWPDDYSITANVVPRCFEGGSRIQYVLDQNNCVKTKLDAS